jgi:hypothetical protein
MAHPTKRRAMFMTVSKSVRNNSLGLTYELTMSQILGRRRAKLTNLPSEVIAKIMKCLEVTDCASLTLSCKHLAQIAMNHQTLEYDLEAPAKPQMIMNFFQMLDSKWTPKTCKLCPKCGKFQSRDPGFWEEHKKKRISRLGGSQATHWASGRVRKFVTLWCDDMFSDCPACTSLRL